VGCQVTLHSLKSLIQNHPTIETLRTGGIALVDAEYTELKEFALKTLPRLTNLTILSTKEFFFPFA